MENIFGHSSSDQIENGSIVVLSVGSPIEVEEINGNIQETRSKPKKPVFFTKMQPRSNGYAGGT